MFTHKTVRQYIDSSNTTIGSTSVLQAPFENNYDNVIAHATTGLEVDWSAIKANIVSLLITATVPMTVETNAHGGGHQDSISLIAGQVIVWDPAHDGMGPCPFAGDVTKLYVTNAGSADGVLRIRALRAA